jgi:hypothetical protein
MISAIHLQSSIVPEVLRCTLDTLTLPEMAGFFILIFKMSDGYIESGLYDKITEGYITQPPINLTESQRKQI